MLDRRLTELIMDGGLEKFVALPLDAERARILVCGNPQMLDDLRGVLTERGLRPDRGRDPGHFAFENYW
jgi:ferredoxin--NADP+ reductase